MSRPGLLAGVRVVDLSMGWAGPLAARHLADMGADVIKVEGCVRFDWWRGWEATEEWINEGGAEKSSAFNMVNRNKRDVTLDLSTERGSDLLKRLVAISDVVVENYSAAVLTKLGLHYAVLKDVNPEIIMISMPAFGTDGPWQGYRAYGSTVEQASGLPHLSGNADDPPTMVHVALGDAVGGITGGAALMTALRAKHRTGRGQYLDVSQSQGLFPVGIQGILTQSATGKPPARLGNRSDRFAPRGVYPCVGDDEWIAIEVRSEPEWQALKGYAELPDLGPVEERLRRVDEVDRAVAAFTQEQVAEVLMFELQALGIRAGHVASGLELASDPHLSSRGFWKLMERDYVGELPHPAAPYRLGDEPFDIDRPAPTLGQHNREVLSQLLHLTGPEIDDLEAEGIIGTKPRLA